MYLGNPFLSLSLIGQRPASYDKPRYEPGRKPLISTEGNECLCLFLSRVPLPTVLVEPGRKG
jgi:hypothetical protein